PARLDDGLGPAFARAIEAEDLPGVTVVDDYQLNVEYAADLANYDVVVFADADTEAVAPFRFERIRPAGITLRFSTHSVSPQAILAMARDMFDAMPRAYVLGIRGYEFNEFDERLSKDAVANLNAAVAFFTGAVRDGAFRPIAGARSTGTPPAVCAATENQ
ncbi:MAG: hydrogenase maturation protease, partial [Planctomycetota bacterium]